MRQLPEFIGLFLGNWWATMSGVVAIALTLVALFIAPDAVDKYLWPGAMLAWFLASYGVWHDEHKLRLSEQEAARRSDPDFLGMVDAICFGDTAEGERQGVLVVNVTNTGGAPSVLQNWRVSILEPGRLEHEIPKFQLTNADDEV